MANRYKKDMQAMVTNVVHLYCKASIGASGAPTLVTANGASLGIASIARTAAGDYTITLDDSYNILLWAGATLSEAGDTDLQIQEAEGTTDVTVAGGGLVAFICTAAATPADPPDGSFLLFKIEVKNSSVSN